MSDLLSSIKMLFENGWKFFTQTDIPGTGISLAVFTVGLVARLGLNGTSRAVLLLQKVVVLLPSFVVYGVCYRFLS